MGYRVTTAEHGRFAIEFEGEPAYCHALEQAPKAMEGKLANGKWVVLLFPVWSGPDRLSITTALDVAKFYSGRLQVGVRPVDDYSENEQWCSGLAGVYNTPIWLMIQNGTVQEIRTGQHSIDSLKFWLSQYVGPPEN